MNTEAAPPPPEKKRGRIARFVTAPARWSLPTKASVLLGVSLLIIALTVWGIIFLSGRHVPWRHSMTWHQVVAILALIVIIPLVLYKCLRLWLEGEQARFPDIDYAWKAGMDALARNGLSLESTPIFLVLGSSDDDLERSLLTASGRRLRVQNVPEGSAPLHWFANPDGVYLFCSDASWLSALSTLSARRGGGTQHAAYDTFDAPVYEASAPAAAQPIAPSAPAIDPAMSPTGTARIGGGIKPPPAPAPSAPAAPPGGGDASRGTMMLDRFVLEQPPPGQAAAPAPAAPSSAAGSQGGSSASSRGTLHLSQSPIAPAPIAPAPTPAATPFAPAPHAPTPTAPTPTASTPAPQRVAASSTAAAMSGGNHEEALLPPQDSAEQLQRLQYVCRLLRQARQPLCAVNGVLVLLPFHTVRGTARESEELQQAVHSDLMTIQRALQLRCPVTALVVSMEQERGFRELVRRVGPESAAEQRFGRRFDVRSMATTEQLAALTAHVCGAFEDWVYALFREQDVLSRPGNTRLYNLLCQVRCNLRPRLSEILSGGFGHDAQLAPDDDPFLFSGCYFAATGPSPDRQAFVKGVFDKLGEEQEQIEWTAQAINSDRRYSKLAYAGLIVGLLMLALGGYFLLERWWS